MRTPVTLEEKYKVAINALQAISQRTADDNEWDQAEAYCDVWRVARFTLRRLGENLYMNNRKGKAGT